ncbi:HlyD family secretion protein [Sulfurovum sp. NBC37-1]|uniref:HlyD family secretion protein n=1 Tax=Sulfurovum sp. (strain NBC37-1) TaxID=387093 RepID=UPI0001587D7B|nr:efflux RND transporter periplasmic adaptor subunit [Sulfurovum sp. NBC37-1]BAF72934.1 multidrug resistance efflux pump [Sulfurovum sp. NBC37-1]
METLMVLTYATFCWIVFKVFKIPVNKWSLTTAVLGGVIMLAVILMGMAFYHPGSKSARNYFVTTPIVSNVRGMVTELDAKPNEPVHKGDILLKIDDTPYKAVLKDLEAQLEFAKKRLADYIELRKVAGGSKFDIHEYEMQVDSLKAKVEKAKFDLDSCVIKAPNNGYVTQIRVRPGQMAVPFPAFPLFTFVNTDSIAFIAAFAQEPLTNIKKGNLAEVIFPSIPGRSFQAHVEQVLPTMAEGEISPDRAMFSFNRQLPPGYIPVVIKIDDNLSAYNMPLGVDAVVATYDMSSPFWSHVAIIRKILLRMQSWQYFLRFH